MKGQGGERREGEMEGGRERWRKREGNVWREGKVKVVHNSFGDFVTLSPVGGLCDLTYTH